MIRLCLFVVLLTLGINHHTVIAGALEVQPMIFSSEGEMKEKNPKLFGYYDLSPRSEESVKKDYKHLDFISEKLYEAYSSYIKEENHLRPLLMITKSKPSALVTLALDGQVIASNVIVINKSLFDSPKKLWVIVAHEMSHYFRKHGPLSIFQQVDSIDGERPLLPNLSNNRSELIPDLRLLHTASRLLYGSRSIGALEGHVIDRFDPIFLFITHYINSIEAEANSYIECSGYTGNVFGLVFDPDPHSILVNAIVEQMYQCPPAEDFDFNQVISFLDRKIGLSAWSPELLALYQKSHLKAKEEYPANPIRALLVTAIHVRSELRKTFDQIDFESIQFFTDEDEADIDAFYVLKKINKGNYVLSLFGEDLCLPEELSYYGSHKESPHRENCWRHSRFQSLLHSSEE